MTDTKKPARTRKTTGAFSDEERAAMKDRAQEVKAAKRGAGKEDGESELLAKIAEMNDSDRAVAERLHELIMSNAAELKPKTWYGMPAYAKDGNVVCFFQPAQKFKSRYATLGFSDKANLDDGSMWPASYALTKLTVADEKKIVALVRKAVSLRRCQNGRKYRKPGVAVSYPCRTTCDSTASCRCGMICFQLGTAADPLTAGRQRRSHMDVST
jgi:uncharacterized protein YdhG (YjbR/CyaY superfamily)